ncbi:hypothetical protein LSH36_71g03034 [Paralvinella palmiformis]|uniref:Uncharacterized protein n=1 Tax=Paralvinella palmiformis TaxID=53620 RepID=A0AAD9K325_9ANNE|nr:hypothetical protein LSH36_71g03034 [Paralvinella palmiformis]
MGCGSSSSIPKNSYPRQSAPVPTSYANCPPVHGAPASSTGMNNGFAEGMLIGGAMAYGGAGYMAPGMMGTQLPGGYHIGPVMPEHSVTVAGIDVL